jgi:AcrR family transcriptional regulator
VVAATICFGQHGYEGTTNQMVADIADVSPGALYHYFQSKADLFVTVGDEVQSEFRRRREENLREGASTGEQVGRVLDALGAWIRERPEIAPFIATYAAEVTRNDEVLRLSPRERWTEPIEFYARLAAAGHDQGDLAADLDEGTFAALVQGLVYGMCAVVSVSRTLGPDDGVIDAFVKLARGDLYEPADQRSPADDPSDRG